MPPRLALAGVVLLGAALRFYPIWFGLPYPQARPDETTVLGHTVAILAGDANPHFFNWPSLTFYLLAGVFTAAGAVKSSLSFADYTLIARASMALAGTVTILILARATRRVADAATATVAALLLAVAILHVRESHFAMTDVLMTLFATACLALVLEAAETRSAASFALAGLAGGLATSTKYSAAPLAIAILAAPGGWRPRLLFFSAFGAGFVAGTPYAVADFGTFRADVMFERAHLAAGHTGADLGRGWTYHLTRSLPYGLGLPTFIAAICGLVYMCVRRNRPALGLGLFAAAFFVAIGSGRTVFFRYVLPLLPLACLSAAVGIRALAVQVAARTRLSPAAATAGLAVIVAAPALLDAARMDLLLARTDTRVLAAEWLARKLRPDDTLYDAGGDYTRLDLRAVRFHEWRYDRASRSFVNAGGRLPDWMILSESPLDGHAIEPSLRDLAVARYALVHTVRGMHGGAGAVFDRQDAFFLPIAGFDGVERPGPNLSIYRRLDAPPR